MIILPTLRGILMPKAAAGGGGSTILWTTKFLDTATLASPNATFTVSAATGNGAGVFTSVLPATGQYYMDVTTDDGYTNGVGFLGIANTLASFQYTTSANYKAWYWSGNWFGDAATISAGDSSALVTGTYRIAIDRTNSRFYMQRTNGTPSTVRSANLPSGSNMYLMMMGQSGFKAVGCSILGGGALINGHGGLY